MGSGAYATVKLVTHKKTGEKYAMKVYDKYKLNDANKKKALTREIAVLKKVDHPNLVKLIEVIETSR